MNVDLSLSLTALLRGTDHEQCPPAGHIQTMLMTLEPDLNLDAAENLYQV